MACRIGITTDEARRRGEWEAKYPSLRNWRALHHCTTKTEAQRLETSLARDQGCESSPGGDGPENGNWVVYRFDY